MGENENMKAEMAQVKNENISITKQEIKSMQKTAKRECTLLTSFQNQWLSRNEICFRQRLTNFHLKF